MVPLAWWDGETAVRAVEAAQTPALHAAFLECADAAALDPTFAEVPGERDRRVGGALGSGRFAGARLPHAEHPRRSGRRAGRLLPSHGGRAGAPGDAWLSILAIRPRFRRSGVGTAVVASLKRELADRGFRFALARVYLDNVPALQFWMRQGFTEVVPHRGDYVGSDLGKPCIVLRASLGA